MSAEDWNVENRDSLPAVLYVHLSKAVTRYGKLLERSRRRGSVDYVAWITRNLLELRIWAEYCSSSAKNADDFMGDSVRDIVDLIRKIGGADPETLAELEHAKGFIGNSRPHHRFLFVADAATEIGLGVFYSEHCKVLSKFVHPTAVSVVAPFKGEAAGVLRKHFYDLGRVLADEAMQKLESGILGERYRKYHPSMTKAFAALPEELRPFQKLPEA